MAIRCANTLCALIVVACSIAPTANAAARQQTETAEQFVERVKRAIKNEEWGRVRSGLKHALDLKKDSPEIYFLFAQTHWRDGERGFAIESLEKAVALQPIYPEAHLLLARYLFEVRNLTRAHEEANLAIGQNAPLFPAYLLLADIQCAQGKAEDAVTSLETGLRFTTDDDKEEMPKIQARIEGLKRIIKFRKEQNAVGIVRPVPISFPHPNYTEEARRAKIQGTISLILLVTESGEVGSVEVLLGLGYGLDEEASKAARAIRFSPATRDGKPVPFLTNVDIEFNLR